MKRWSLAPTVPIVLLSLAAIGYGFGGGPVVSSMIAPSLPQTVPPTNPKNPPGTQPQTPPGTQPQTPPGTQPQTPPGTQPQTPPGTQPQTPPGTQPQTPPGTQPQTPPGTQPQTPPGTPPQTLPGTLPQTAPGALPNTPPQVQNAQPMTLPIIQGPGQIGGVRPSTSDTELSRYGDDLFVVTRQSITAARQKPTAPGNQDAFSGPVGPTSLGAVNATPPDSYILGPGDKLSVQVGSQTLETKETKLTLDQYGQVSVPYGSNSLTLAGQNLAQAQKSIANEVARFVRNPNVRVRIDELRTYQVSVLGESFAPGVYTVPATYTLFNLILATGGPNVHGSVRTIELRRAGSTAVTFDLYPYLMNADTSRDIPLMPGDVIYYPVSRGYAAVTGEVNRPASFELLGNETLGRLLGYAGGVRPSAVAQNVAVDSVIPGSIRKLFNLDLSNQDSLGQPVYDGDKVRVFSIRTELRNEIEVRGPVEQPRSYALQPGMRVSDAIDIALGLLPQADKTIADLNRRNPDNSYTLIRLDLARVLRKDPAANVELKPYDILSFYDVNDLSWRGERLVILEGAVRSPGTFYRADNMTVGDLLRQGRGLNFDAYTQEALLQRYNRDGTPGPLVKVNLVLAATGDPKADLALNDRDRLRVFTTSEWQAVPELSIKVQGAVQRPSTYPLATNMRLRSLLELAGGLTLDAHQNDAFLQRVNRDGTFGPLLMFSPKKVLAGDESQNYPLEPRDVIRLFTVFEWKAAPDRVVEVVGAVQRPGNYPYATNMTVADLLNQAGGPTLDASTSRAFIQRTNLDGTVGPLLVFDVTKALAGDPQNNPQLQARDKLSVQTLTDAEFRVSRTITLKGGVQRPGTYPAASNMTLQDAIALAGGLLPDAAGQAQISEPWKKIGQGISIVAFSGTVGEYVAPEISIKPGSVISILQRSDIIATPRVVTILGQVERPGSYAILDRSETISQIVKRAGGLTRDAYPRSSRYLRQPSFLRSDQQVALVPRLQEVMNKVASDEYRRAEALLNLDRLKLVFSKGSTITTSLTGATAAQPALETTKTGISVDAALGKALATEGVTLARTLGDTDILPSGNLNARVDRAINRPRSSDDINVLDGDVIIIPSKPTTVTVGGAVQVPSTLLFESKLSIEDYIRRSGGMTRDADKDTVLIVRTSGELVKYRRGIHAELGDMIFIPTRTQGLRFRDEGGQLMQLQSGITSAAVTIALLRSIGL